MCAALQHWPKRETAPACSHLTHDLTYASWLAIDSAFSTAHLSYSSPICLSHQRPRDLSLSLAIN